MDLSNCECKKDCTALAVVAGVIIGIITAFLRITAVITVPTVALTVALGIGVGALGLTLSFRTEKLSKQDSRLFLPSFLYLN